MTRAGQSKYESSACNGLDGAGGGGSQAEVQGGRPGGLAGGSLGLRLVRRGKVREVYALPDADGAERSGGESVSAIGPSGGVGRGDWGGEVGGGGRLLIVASDRISAFDVVLPTPIPGKGALLTEISAWWFRFIEGRVGSDVVGGSRGGGICETHLISTDVDELTAGLLSDSELASIRGRSTIARACRPLAIECVVRGYLEGSGWKEYESTGRVCGVSLPRGLERCGKLPEPIFTPATKAAEGHDENITFEQAAEIVGLETAASVRDLSLRIYAAASAYALERGIIIADTKFEFGVLPDAEPRSGRVWHQPILIDEALTPDSSRFWPADGYKPGRPQPSFDKQFVREYLEGLVASGAWDKNPPGPELPDAVVRGTVERYTSARDRLCGPGLV